VPGLRKGELARVWFLTQLHILSICIMDIFCALVYLLEKVEPEDFKGHF
jgi:hypothetical protein